MDTFITSIAWIFGTISTVLTLLRIIGWLSYTELDELRDQLHGIARTFPIHISGSIAVICWAWILN